MREYVNLKFPVQFPISSLLCCYLTLLLSVINISSCFFSSLEWNYFWWRSRVFLILTSGYAPRDLWREGQGRVDHPLLILVLKKDFFLVCVRTISFGRVLPPNVVDLPWTYEKLHYIGEVLSYRDTKR